MKPKLVLLDVFSYSCMNCLRSLEFIKRIDAKYRTLGLCTILVHPPEWEFEKNERNVMAALKELSINFPAVIDKNKAIIKEFNVNFWPAQILTNGGKVLYRHIGEGSYKMLEMCIRRALKIKGMAKIFRKEPVYSKFPTVYLGKRKKKIVKRHGHLKFGAARADGSWVQKEECLEIDNGSITIMAKGTTNCVAESADGRPAKISISVNGRFIKNLTIKKPKLYNIAKSGSMRLQKLTLATKSKASFYSFSFR